MIYEDQDSISQMISNKDFPPNSKQTIICSVTEAMSHLQIRVSRLDPCTYYIMIYNSSAQEAKATNFYCYAFTKLVP